MTEAINYTEDQSKEEEIHVHLQKCDADFVPRLSSRIDLKAYAKKIFEKSTRLEAWAGQELIGLIAVYLTNKEAGEGFITNVSVLSAYAGKKVASQLLQNCIEAAKREGFLKLILEVNKGNERAINFYKKHNFEIKDNQEDHFLMQTSL